MEIRVEKKLRCGWINYEGRPVRPTRYQPRATPWESVMCDSRPERAKALPKTILLSFQGVCYTCLISGIVRAEDC